MNGWVFDVTENGQWVAGGEAPDRDTAVREAGHYVMMYGQDGGDVKATVREDDGREHCPYCDQLIDPTTCEDLDCPLSFPM